MQVVGLDGYEARWLAVVLDDGRFRRAEVVTRVQDALGAWPEAAVVGIDVPVGLPAGGRRRADEEARAFVGPLRASVFFAPRRTVLEQETYAGALAETRRLLEPGISRQSYALRKKILEVEQLAPCDDRLMEVHPEVSFRAMASQPLAHGKRAWNGLAERRRLLAEHGVGLPDRLAGEAGLAPPDHVLDAAAAAWSANRVALGLAGTLPAEPERDEHGRPVAIRY